MPLAIQWLRKLTLPKVGDRNLSKSFGKGLFFCIYIPPTSLIEASDFHFLSIDIFIIIRQFPFPIQLIIIKRNQTEINIAVRVRSKNKWPLNSFLSHSLLLRFMFDSSASWTSVLTSLLLCLFRFLWQPLWFVLSVHWITYRKTLLLSSTQISIGSL